jgi:hypothetical protein
LPNLAIFPKLPLTPGTGNFIVIKEDMACAMSRDFVAFTIWESCDVQFDFGDGSDGGDHRSGHPFFPWLLRLLWLLWGGPGLCCPGL